jgi:hypothetical protein
MPKVVGVCKYSYDHFALEHHILVVATKTLSYLDTLVQQLRIFLGASCERDNKLSKSLLAQDTGSMSWLEQMNSQWATDLV